MRMTGSGVKTTVSDDRVVRVLCSWIRPRCEALEVASESELRSELAASSISTSLFLFPAIIPVDLSEESGGAESSYYISRASRQENLGLGLA
jgi:hypothetical protein